MNDFLEQLVTRLGILFASPEEIIIRQEEESTDLLFITYGDCIVNIDDRHKKEQQCVKLLSEGDNFGEISAYFHCLRTASVVSRTYTTMALLSQPHFKDIIRDYQEFEYSLLKQIYRYNYDFKTFMYHVFN